MSRVQSQRLEALASRVQSQRLDALERANKARMDAAYIRKLLREERITVSNALDQEMSKTLSAFRLISAVPGWGRVRTMNLLRYVAVSEGRRVGDMTNGEKQRIKDRLFVITGKL